jgi:hypothetical protein
VCFFIAELKNITFHNTPNEIKPNEKKESLLDTIIPNKYKVLTNSFPTGIKGRFKNRVLNINQ